MTETHAGPELGRAAVAKPICLVIGAGTGNVGIALAREGYHGALCRRSDAERLARVIADIEGTGCAASGYVLNVVEPHSLGDLVAEVEAIIGWIEDAVYKLGGQHGTGALADTSYKAFEVGWRLATIALFRFPSAVLSLMVSRGKGT